VDGELGFMKNSIPGVGAKRMRVIPIGMVGTTMSPKPQYGAAAE
jgi:hypothetical protein